MSTEREQLELAAKAAGLHNDVQWDDKWGCLTNYEWLTFDPINDDGDALRLAVKLEMMVDTVNRVVAGYLSDVCIEIDYDEQEKDPYAATRLAIVRAAAEIGRKMG